MLLFTFPPISGLHALDSVSSCSITVLEHILSHEDCDVDPQNKLEGATPLHLALRVESSDARLAVVESLLDAGADISYVLYCDASDA